MRVDLPTLAQEFPSFLMRLPAAWWRVHRREHGPWHFTSSPPGSGRFDLAPPHGTCYLADDPVGAFIEVFRDRGVTLALEQVRRNKRRLAQMPLDGWIGRIADFTAPSARQFGVTDDLSTGPDHARSRPWAEAARNGGFGGIAYWLSQDPQRRRIALALFGPSGEHPPNASWSTSSTQFAVGSGAEAAELFGGERSAPTP